MMFYLKKKAISFLKKIKIGVCFTHLKRNNFENDKVIKI